MSVIVFDTETTAAEPGQICQLAYLVIDGGRAEGRNYYFTVDAMTPRAAGVHGLTREGLKALSGGRRFGDCAPRILADFAAASLLAGHGVAFDERFLRAEFERCGIELAEKETFCTRDFFVQMMRSRFGRRVGWPSLAQLAAHYGLEREAIAANARACFGGGDAPHDARYDAAATWLVMREAAARGDANSLSFGGAR